MAATSTKHVVLFPFPAQGHLACFLEAARLLRRALPGDVAITLVSTPLNVSALSASSSPSSSSVSFHALPFVPADHGLPANSESISSLPPPAFLTLFEAYESLEPAFDAYISRLVADKNNDRSVCIIADVFVAWTVRVARSRGCAHSILVSCGALGTATLHALWRNMPAPPPFADDGLLRLPGLPEVELHQSQVSPWFLSANGAMDGWTSFHHRQMQHGYLTDAVLMNTVQELEPTGLAMVRRTLGKQVHVWPIGPLVRDGSSETSATVDSTAVKRWLDSQAPSSVLYVSFGSQNSIRPKQMMELATALESTQQPFIWAFRPPVGLDDIGGGDEWLPEGFEARARATNRGLLVHGWAPQVSILAHASTGAFLSHCGWNSVLESLTHGVPIVGWPLSAEQFYNVKMLEEELGVCVEVARGNLESSALDSRQVAEVLETVMGDTAEAAEIRRRAAEVQEVMKRAWEEEGGSSKTALQEFFTAMRLPA